ncbi:MAG: HipA protein [uncultured Sulfurovum sp.]|uniref:HipA protein n=1 Tax=uncultured Sulfurovum sp. TaxID=269237 RepID=A0A6S6TT08_9BACT|nr:MAG: HipA protein [uncultured Sulfurovum sp.]
MNSLKVSMQNQVVGKLSIDSEEKYHFEYDKPWIEKGFSISPHLPFDQEFSSITIKRFLENLIPEGEGLEDIASFAHISKNNTFAIIHSIGYDTAGALFFGNKSEANEPIFREISLKELTGRIEELESKSIAIWDKKVRLSLAGVQAKLPVIIKESKIGLANGTLSSTHIMKFQTKKYLHIVANELFCMTLAKKIGLNVANVEMKKFATHPTLLIERFDRIYKNDFVERLHIIDACQITNLPPTYKYEQNFGSSRDVEHIREGASFEKLFEATKLCSVPAVAQLELLNWAMFNLIIGNSDAHGKNFSFFVDKKGIKPTPFYDLLCVMMYDFDHNLAMAYGDEFNPNKVFAYQLREFSEDVGVNYKLVSKILLKQCDMIIKVLKENIVDRRLLTKEEFDFIEKLSKFIFERTLKFKEIALEIPLVSYL